MSQPVEIFCCAADADHIFLEKLSNQLFLQQQNGLITLWDKSQISAGVALEEEIKQHLTRARIFLLFISADFLIDQYCYGTVMKGALERYARGEATIIPVIVRPTLWQDIHLLKHIQVLPKNGQPISGQVDQESALLEVAAELYTTIQRMKEPTIRPATGGFSTGYPAHIDRDYRPGGENFSPFSSHIRHPAPEQPSHPYTRQTGVPLRPSSSPIQTNMYAGPSVSLQSGQYAQLTPGMARTPGRTSSTKMYWVIGIIAVLVLGSCGLWASARFMTANLSKGSTSTSTITPNTSSNTPIPSSASPAPSVGNSLYSANWSKGLANWTGSSQWKWIEDGTLESDGTGDANTGLGILAPYHSTTSDYTVEAQLQLLDFTSAYFGEFGVVVRENGGNGYICYLSQSAGTGIVYTKVDQAYNYTPLAEQRNYTSDKSLHTFRVEVKADHIAFFIDGQLVVQTVDSSYQNAGLIGLRAYEAKIKILSFRVFKA